MSFKNKLIMIVSVGVAVALMILLLAGGVNRKVDKKIAKVKKYGAIVEYAADSNAKVVLTISGRINAKEDHREARISVTQSFRRVEVVQGYNNNVIQSKTYDNTDNAYSAFIFALGRVGYGIERKNVTFTDDRSVCPFGQRYAYYLYGENNTELFRLWAASCTTGTAAFAHSPVNQLFQAQIPQADWNEFSAVASIN